MNARNKLTIDLMRIDTHITTVRFWRDPTPSLEADSEWQLPLLPQLLLVFKETPSPLCVYSMRMVYNMGMDSH